MRLFPGFGPGKQLGLSRLWMVMSHRHLRWGPGCGILSLLSLWSSSSGASSVAGEGHQEVLGVPSTPGWEGTLPPWRVGQGG